MLASKQQCYNLAAIHNVLVQTDEPVIPFYLKYAEKKCTLAIKVFHLPYEMHTLVIYSVTGPCMAIILATNRITCNHAYYYVIHTLSLRWHVMDKL